MSNPTLQLSGFSFAELFDAKGLYRLDQEFLHELRTINPSLLADLLAYRDDSREFSAIEVSELLLNVAPILEDFLIHLFNIEKAALKTQTKTLGQNPVSVFKKFFVLRRAKKELQKVHLFPTFSELNDWLNEKVARSPLRTNDHELSISLLATFYIADLEKHSVEIEKLTQWCVHALVTPEAKKIVEKWTSFRIPERLDYEHLISKEVKEYRERDGFALTDARFDIRYAQDEVNYCIYCHDHDGDFCSKGFPAKKGDPSLGFKKNPLDVTLTGCPLDEKISEMNILKRDGFTIAALAMVMVDNPMCPATGHRICNDCMKACIYQKQDPVNIPQIETRVLVDVLNLPWGVEIYDLLTRFNPLRKKQWVMKPYNGSKIMIAGMGPAGFTLAHHLLLEGFAVVGFDGLKIEPLPSKYLQKPIYEFATLKESLDSRLMAGFGGVAEYGITVRWDKNFLKLIYISLMRRPYFQVFGSTRFGGTVNVNDAWELGFDHFVIAVGAGLPKALPIPGSLAPGMRQANDFLMALQLGNAAKKDSLTNIQIRLPAVIIGGGLTGVDTATEIQAYYITQVEKTLSRYEKLTEFYGENSIREKMDPCSLEILDEFISHAKAVREERVRAQQLGVKPNFIPLIHQWGGVSIIYRRTMQESPAYINNHEELAKALEEGVFYLESLQPVRAELNAFGFVETLICQKTIKLNENTWETLPAECRIPARAILVATGTKPNIAYEFEHRGTFLRSGSQYQHFEDVDGELTLAHGVANNKDPMFGPFTSYHQHDRRVSLIGDTHPVFHGSVVKAIASGLRTYPKILEILKSKINYSADISGYEKFRQHIFEIFSAKITDIRRHTSNVIELTVKAPLATKHFEPGHFYRLQNYETFAPKLDHTSLQMEPLALIAANVDKNNGLLTFMVMENGASSKLCATLKVNDPISLMGPTGVRAKISHANETVLIIGNQLSIPLLTSYGKALREMGNRVLYLGMFESKDEVFCKDKLENSADSIIWSVKHGPEIECSRNHDYSLGKNLIEILELYSEKTEPLSRNFHSREGGNPLRMDPCFHGDGHEGKIPLADIDRIYVIGNSELLRQVEAARHNNFKKYFLKDPIVYGSVFSTMQCMLKGVCAQCLQWQIDPETGLRTKAVFACSWQEQPLELIDFDNLDERQIQNRMQETLSNLWVDFLFKKFQVQKI